MQQRQHAATWAVVLAMAVMAASALGGCEREATVDAGAQAQEQAQPDGKRAPTPRDVADPALSPDGAGAQTAAAQSGGPEVERRPIYDLLGETVEAAVKVDTFDDLIERFSKEDRKRLGRVANDALNAQTTALRDAWKARFEGEFNIIDTEANFEPMTRIERAQPAGDGNDRARVVVQPREPSQRPFELVLVREDEKWRIDLPDGVDRQKLQDTLVQRLDALKQQTPKWTEELQGHRDIAFEALSAMGQPPAAKPKPVPGQRQPGR